MNQLLKKPWFVAALALAALYFVGEAVWSAVAGARARGAAAEAAPEENAAVAAGATPAGAIEAILRALPLPAQPRDPFARPVPAATETPAVAAVPVAPNEAVERLRLTAVWLQGDRRCVLLNGRVLAAGETLGRCTVESVTTEGAWIVHPRGREFVGVGRELLVKVPANGPTPSPSL